MRFLSKAFLIEVIFLFAATLCRGALAVQTTGLTATQIIFSYTAPDANPCQISVSEESDLTPLVHDVNSALFAGANQDASRFGSLVSGTSRIVVIGRRIPEKALDGKVYSRALQAYTQHYYRVQCGAEAQTGNFTTSNIPLGNTYNDVLPLDPDDPGTVLMPTLPTDRATTIVDPQTGALLRRLSLPGDAGTRTPFPYFGGSTRMCSNVEVGPGPGFVCTAPTTSGGPAALYYIIPDTGEVRYLGNVIAPSASGTNGWKGGFIVYPFMDLTIGNVLYYTLQENSGASILVKGTYVGSYAEAAPNTTASLTWENLTPSPNDPDSMMKALDPRFDETVFGCHVGFSDGNYAQITCSRSIQDSYGWVGALDMQTKRVVGALPVYLNPQTRWCGNHHVQLIPGQPMISLTLHGHHGSPSSVPGVGPYQVTLTQAVSSGDTVLQVSGEPTSPYGDAYPSLVQPGDIFQFLSGKREFVRVVSRLSATSWQVSRGAINPAVFSPEPFAAGVKLQASCNATAKGGNWNQPYWKFLEDPNGNDPDGSSGYIIDDKLVGGHTDWDTNYRIMTDYPVVAGPILSNIGQPVSFHVESSPRFAGVRALAYGTGYAKHPSKHQAVAPPAEQNWFIDMLPFAGGNLYSQTPTGAQNISGNLYKYIFGFTGGLYRKQHATLATTGGKGLEDVSGPGSFISDGAADNYKYCVANVAGECRPGSQPGDVFANVPGVDYLRCFGSDVPYPVWRDICIHNMATYGQGVVQFGLLPNREGLTSADPASYYGAGYSRILTRGLGGWKDIHQLAKPIPDGRWAIFGIGGLNYKGLGLVKIPPFQKDALNRSTFIPLQVPVTPPNGLGVHNAVVAFGYAEHGNPEDFFCTSRQEACLAVSNSVTESNPFKFAVTEPSAGVPCASGCTVTVPLLPQKIAYYQVIYRDASNQELGRSVMQAGAELTSPLPPEPLPLSILNVRADVHASSVTVRWETNVAADSQVDYGRTLPYAQQTPVHGAMTTAHAVVLSGLEGGRTYNYRVRSRDAENNVAVSGNATFLSGGASDVTPPSKPSGLKKMK